MLTLEQARALVDAYAPTAGATWFPDAELVERPGYWFFPVGFIGSKGVIVDKTTGALTPVGSSHTLDDWLWGYEQNFLSARVTLRVTSVINFDRTLQVLQGCVTADSRWRYELRDWLKVQLATLPADLAGQDLALAIPNFRAAVENAWFTFEVEAPQRRCS